MLALHLLAAPLLAACNDSPTAPTPMVVDPDRDDVTGDGNGDTGNGTDDGDDPPVATEPPFQGTVFVSPRIIIPSDASRLGSLAARGRGERRVFDRRVGAWATEVVRLFEVRYTGKGSAVEFQVNLEFEQQAAHREVDYYAEVIGRLPAKLLVSLLDVEIHAGNERFGGNGATGTIHIHTEYQEARSSYIEEAMFHEASHVSLDPERWPRSTGWRPVGWRRSKPTGGSSPRTRGTTRTAKTWRRRRSCGGRSGTASAGCRRRSGMSSSRPFPTGWPTSIASGERRAPADGRDGLENCPIGSNKGALSDAFEAVTASRNQGDATAPQEQPQACGWPRRSRSSRTEGVIRSLANHTTDLCTAT